MAGSDRRAAVLAHFDAGGGFAPHVGRLVEALAAHAGRVILVTASGLPAAARADLPSHVEVVDRPNRGHDFAGYRDGIARVDLGALDELIVVNDSAVLPLVPLERILAARGDVDIWGLTPGYGFAPHVQSYFLVLGPRALRSPALAAFWRGIAGDGDRDHVIAAYEVGLGAAARAAGLTLGAYYRPGPLDRLVGAARSHAAEASGLRRDRQWRRLAGWLRRTIRRARSPEWNVAASLADRAARRRPALPAVKLSTLREDPYGLDAPRLLAGLERRHPEAFDGVRSYLERTDPAYGDRWRATVDRARDRPAPRWARYRA